MASPKTQLVTSHVKNYVQAIFAERLQSEGFHSFENRDICWYRMRGDHIINTISFYSSWNNIPVFLSIGYGIHPLFAFPYFMRQAYASDCPINNEIFGYQPIVEKKEYTQAPFSHDAQVYAPNGGGRGIYAFDSILLPQMDQVFTVADCYALHRQRCFNKYEPTLEMKFGGFSQTFIDEAIYVDDNEVYPYCRTSIERSINIWVSECERYPQKKEYADMLQHYIEQKHALFDNAREEYLKILEQRQQKNIAILRKKYGIIV